MPVANRKGTKKTVRACIEGGSDLSEAEGRNYATFRVMASTRTKSRGSALREPVSAMKSPKKGRRAAYTQHAVSVQYDSWQFKEAENDSIYWSQLQSSNTTQTLSS